MLNLSFRNRIFSLSTQSTVFILAANAAVDIGIGIALGYFLFH